MPTYTYPTNAELITIAQELVPDLTMDDPIFSIFPIRMRNASRLRWQQMDNFVGTMDLRGAGGEPIRINRVGTKIYEAEPGYFGNFGTLDEVEMTNRAMMSATGIGAAPIKVTDLVNEVQLQLLSRQVTSIKSLMWNLAISGALTLTLPNGGVGFSASYSLTTFTASPLWSSTTTATPLADLLSMQRLHGRGTSNFYDSRATLWLNSKDSANVLQNSNALDLGGKRVSPLSTITSMEDVNRFLLAQGSPQIRVYDGSYLDNSGAVQMYIPDGTGLLVAGRPGGETPGEFQMTRNLMNPDGAPGPYTFVDDRTQGVMKSVPPRIDVHGGFNGGPCIVRPTQLIKFVIA